MGIAEIVGWALKKSAEGVYEPARVDIVIDGQRFGPTLPNQFRADIAAMGWGDGRCGFLRLPSDDTDYAVLPEQIKVFFSGTDIELPVARGTPIPLPAVEIQGYSGNGEFIGVGEQFKRHLIELCGLGPDADFLDIGCGIGRIARSLAGFFSVRGRYRGFDVAANSIAWCRDNIESRHPNFDFQLVAVHNDHYSPGEPRGGSDFTFPYPSDCFDVSLAASVYTHLLPEVAANYIRETARVLKPGGRALVTAFLINSDSRYLIKTGQSKIFTFGFEKAPYRYQYVDRPEQGLAYEESWMIEQFENAGLQIEGGVRYGMWCGRKQALSYQDIIIVRKG
jgi:ubiquinone/menaquinone biosynthesis C-methylase UbiE